MRVRVAALRLTTVSLLLFVAVTANAQTAQDKRTADELFEQGRKLMIAGRYADACPKFAESQRLDAGIGTLLRLADCHERVGKSATAWAEYVDAAATAARANDAREKIARKRADEIEAHLPRFLVKSTSSTPGLTIRRGEVALDKPAWGQPIPTDPGVQVFRASAPGKKEWRREVDFKMGGGTTTIAVPELADEGADSAASRKEEEPGQRQRMIAVSAGAAGVAGVIVGTIFGVMASSDLSASNADGHCRPDNRCDAVGKGLRDDYLSNAGISTVAFVIGIAGLGAGAVLWFTAPRADKRAAVYVSPTGVSLRATW